MTINEALLKLQNLPQRIADEGEQMMKDEVPIRTGELHDSIHSEVSTSSVFIGTSKHYAKYVEFGRGPVYPVQKKVLHWEDKYGDVFAMRAGPAKANDFVGRTARRLRAYISGGLL